MDMTWMRTQGGHERRGHNDADADTEGGGMRMQGCENTRRYKGR